MLTMHKLLGTNIYIFNYLLLCYFFFRKFLKILNGQNLRRNRMKWLFKVSVLQLWKGQRFISRNTCCFLLVLRCGVEVSTPPDRKTAAERERLKKEAQIRRRIEADVSFYTTPTLSCSWQNFCLITVLLFSFLQLNGFDLTLQSIIMAEFEEKYFQ